MYIGCDIITILEKILLLFLQVGRYLNREWRSISISCTLHNRFNHVLHICTIFHLSMSITKMTTIRFTFSRLPPGWWDCGINYNIIFFLLRIRKKHFLASWCLISHNRYKIFVGIDFFFNHFSLKAQGLKIYRLPSNIFIL